MLHHYQVLTCLAEHIAGVGYNEGHFHPAQLPRAGDITSVGYDLPRGRAAVAHEGLLAIFFTLC